jgi:quercetin dioxygenase-like cupin family protein
MKRLLVCAICLLAVSVLAQQTPTRPAPSGSAMAVPHAQMFQPDELQWSPAPASLPPGAQVAVLEGSPTQSGPFTMRLKVPDGYTIPPHTHPAREHVTVISGTFNLGMGEKFDPAQMQSFGPGGYFYADPGSPHFVRTSGETIVQVNGIGPWGINYINPADDPRKTAK